MRKPTLTLAVVALALTLTAGLAAAQQTTTKHSTRHHATRHHAKTEVGSSASSTWSDTKDMTRREWNAAKTKWAKEKVKWQECNRRSEAEKLSAPKSWSYIARCMTTG